MKIIKNYNDYIIDIILENTSAGKLPFFLSEKFKNILKSIEHDIANDILDLEITEETEMTLIDITDRNDVVTMATSTKILDYLSKKLNKETIHKKDFFINTRTDEIWSKNRIEIKIGKLVKKLFGHKYPDSGKNGMDIESFVNMYKSVYDGDSSLFDIVEGDNIIYWYNYDNYISLSHVTPLHKSCMSHSNCSDFLNFYVLNKDKVKMLILYENDSKEKIVARSLLWYLDEPNQRVYMDRIYYSNDMYINTFINYAQKNGWLYKKNQTFYSTEVIDSTNNTEYYHLKMSIKNIKLNRYYPYLDTFKYLYQDNRILSNSVLNIGEQYGELQSTHGDIINLSWSDYYNKFIDINEEEYRKCYVGTDDLVSEDKFGNFVANKYRLKKDATYLKYYQSYIPNDLIKDDTLVQTTYGQEYLVLKNDAVWLKDIKEYTTLEYADRNNLI